MRFSLRLMLPVIACIAAVSGLFAYYQEQDQERALHAELNQRASLTAQSLADNLQPLLDKNSSALELRRALNRFSTRERIVGAAIFDDSGKSIAITERLPIALEDAFSVLTPKIDPQDPDGQGVFLTLGPRFYHAQMLSMRRADGKAMGLAVFHDAGFIREQNAVIWRQTLIHVSLEVLLIVLITFLIIRWSLMSPISKAAQWLKALRSGKSEIAAPRSELLGPLAREMENVVKSLQEARAAAAREARLREASESLWTSDRLSVHVRKRLQNRRLVVVSNREPYIHTRQNGNLEIMIPASGLVTALEPILRSCDGTWIAQASGDADREAVDEHDRLRVPPAEPQYTLRRVWLEREEENGYYFGFANEGLWPLCHIAHTRPIFRSENWEHYQQVNRKFADAVLEEIADTQKPFILVQDYHFALLPRMIKKERPDARVAIFWHIPWPNAEAFGICPWERELVDGLLGADLVGFHIQNHCNNFLETVDHAVECRIEWEGFTVNRAGHLTRVRPFPISIDFADARAENDTRESPYIDRAALLAGVGVQAQFMGVGVDRVDYTKGILERFRGIERFLEKYPHYQGKFTFVQIGAPSRMQIKRYLELYADVESEANRICRRFMTNLWKPIVLLKRHHSHQEIERFYRASDLCLVTSLHDGMNLVAKEYVAARDDDRGVLILSRFAGASRELHDALIVNPYDTELIADAIHSALEMPAAEIERRMQSLRRTVRELNIYRWAANLISELADIRLPQPAAVTKTLRGAPIEIDAAPL